MKGIDDQCGRYSDLGKPGTGKLERKIGKVIAVVPPGESALGWVPAEAKKSHVKFEVDIYLKGDRAVVAVPAGTYGGLTHYYAPRVSVLEKRMEECTMDYSVHAAPSQLLGAVFRWWCGIV